MVLNADFRRPLQRVGQAVAAALFGVPVVERGDDEEVVARQVDAEFLDGVAQLHGFQAQVFGVVDVEGRTLGVVGA